MIKRPIIFLIFSLISVLLSCQEETVYYFADICGFIKDSASQTGVNNIIIDVFDFDPEQDLKGRWKGSDTTESNNGQPGFYKMAGVCYGSNKGIYQIGVMVDSLKNPLYRTIRTYQSIKSATETLPDIFIKRK